MATKTTATAAVGWNVGKVQFSYPGILSSSIQAFLANNYVSTILIMNISASVRPVKKIALDKKKEALIEKGREMGREKDGRWRFFT